MFDKEFYKTIGMKVALEINAMSHYILTRFEVEYPGIIFNLIHKVEDFSCWLFEISYRGSIQEEIDEIFGY